MQYDVLLRGPLIGSARGLAKMLRSHWLASSRVLLSSLSWRVKGQAAQDEDRGENDIILGAFQTLLYYWHRDAKPTQLKVDLFHSLAFQLLFLTLGVPWSITSLSEPSIINAFRKISKKIN